MPAGIGAATERDLSWLDAANLADLSPDGNRALFHVRARAGEGAGRLFVIDVDGTTITPVTPEGVAVAGAGWVPSPDGWPICSRRIQPAS